MHNLKLVNSGPHDPDWFAEVIAQWVKVSNARAAQQSDADYLRECVEFRREHTNEKHVFDKCNSWLGRRS